MAPFGNSLLVTAEGTIAVDENNRKGSDPQTTKSTSTKDTEDNKDDNSVVRNLLFYQHSLINWLTKSNSFQSLKPLRKSEPHKYVWRNIIVFLYLHVGTFYGFYLLFTGQAKATTFYFGKL